MTDIMLLDILAKLDPQTNASKLIYNFVYNNDYELTLQKYTQKNGKAYSSLACLAVNINNSLKKINACTSLYDLYTLVRMPYPLDYNITETKILDFVLQDYANVLFDKNIFFDIIKHYKLYYDDVYYFFIIKSVEHDKFIRYNFHRYIAQLPYYNKLGNDKYLPTVDHINRNKKDCRLDNLRYCTHKQNSANVCKTTYTNIFHGVSSDGETRLKKEPERTSYDYKCLIWCKLLEEYISTQPPSKRIQLDLKYISIDECCEKVKPELPHIRDHLHIMDKFVSAFLNMPSTEYVYNKDTTLSDIPQSQYDFSYTLLRLVQVARTRSNCTFTLTRFKLHHIGGLAFDLSKYREYGEFAHMNFLKPKKPQPILQFNKKNIMSPVDILNLYEKERNGNCRYYLRDDGIIGIETLPDSLPNGESCLRCLDDTCIIDRYCYYKKGNDENDDVCD